MYVVTEVRGGCRLSLGSQADRQKDFNCTPVRKAEARGRFEDVDRDFEQREPISLQ